MTATINKHTRIMNADNFLESFSRQSPDYIYLGIGKNTTWSHYQKWENESGTPTLEVDFDIENTDTITFYKNGILQTLNTDYSLNYVDDELTIISGVTTTDILELYIVSDTSAPTPRDNEETTLGVWSELVAAKRITSNNVVPCIKRYNWTEGTIYHEYNHTLNTIIPLVDSVEAPMYVMNQSGNVYKCIETPRDNNGDMMPSLNEPNIVSTGIFSTADGYRWKFMYSVSIFDALNFMTDEYIPVRTLVKDNGSAQWQTQIAAIDGAVHHFEILNGGSGYTNGAPITLNGVGTGFTGTIVAPAGVITGITITTEGTGYREDTTVTIGGGTGAVVKPIISPIGGHGANAREELEGIYVMCKVILDSDEQGVLTSTLGTTYRQLCLLLNPHSTTLGTKFLVESYGNKTFSDVIVRAVDNLGQCNVVTWNWTTGEMYLSGVPLGVYTEGTEIKMQGDDETASIISIIDNVYLPATQSVYLASNLAYGSGKVMYVENREALQRNLNQAEDIRLVIEF